MAELAAPVPDPMLEGPLAALIGVDGVRAIFLAGSHGTGEADLWSDVDLVAVAPPDRQGALGDIWVAALRDVAEIIHLERRGQGGLLINGITAAWLRVDLYLVEDIAARAQDGLRPLWDPEDLWSRLPAETPRPGPPPDAVARMTREAIRILGLLPVGIGREEWVTLHRGLAMLRDMLVEVAVLEAGPRHRGGILHLRRLIPADLHAQLAALPQGGPSRDLMAEAFAAHAALLLPGLRRLSERAGLTWPERFEEATREVLAARLGFALPPSRPRT